jgi:hypothetical protein
MWPSCLVFLPFHHAPTDGPVPAKLFYVSHRIRLPVQVCSVDDFYLVVPSSEEIQLLWQGFVFPTFGPH